MNIEKVTITPKMAKVFLAKNTRNRPVNERNLSVLAGEMLSGRWKFNGDAIRMNGDLLIDGQHRLLACMKSDVEFETLLIDGLNPDVFDTIDAGRKRKPSDTLAILGEINTSALASSLIFIDHYLTGNVRTRPSITSTKIEALLIENPENRESVRIITSMNFSRMAPTSILVGLHYLFSRSSKEAADDFFKSFSKGINLCETDAIYLLRERLMKNLIRQAKLPRHHLSALIIKAWNATVINKPMRSLRWQGDGANKEAFPTIKSSKEGKKCAE